MRFSIKITMLLAATLSAMALSAGTASATAGDPVEVTDTQTGEHCTPACFFTLSGFQVDLYAHVPFFGEIFRYSCNMDLQANINEDGVGLVTFSSFSGLTYNCQDITHCEFAWPLSVDHDEAGSETLTIDMCIDTPIVDCEGEWSTSLEETPFGVGAEWSNSAIGGTVCEFETGSGLRDHLSDAFDTIDVAHL